MTHKLYILPFFLSVFCSFACQATFPPNLPNTSILVEVPTPDSDEPPYYLGTAKGSMRDLYLYTKYLLGFNNSGLDAITALNDKQRKRCEGLVLWLRHFMTLESGSELDELDELETANFAKTVQKHIQCLPKRLRQVIVARSKLLFETIQSHTSKNVHHILEGMWRNAIERMNVALVDETRLGEALLDGAPINSTEPLPAENDESHVDLEALAKKLNAVANVPQRPVDELDIPKIQHRREGPGCCCNVICEASCFSLVVVPVVLAIISGNHTFDGHTNLYLLIPIMVEAGAFCLVALFYLFFCFVNI